MFAILRNRAVLAAAVAALLLTACGLPPLHRSVVVQTNDNGVPVHATGQLAHDRYTVVRGDTLYSIAFRANVDFRALARWNGIGPPYVIQPGQVLRLTRPPHVAAQAPQAPVFETVTPAPAPPKHASAPPPPTAVVQAPAPATSTVVAVAGQAPVSASPTAPVAAPSIPAGATRAAGGIAWRWPAAGAVLSGFDPSHAMPGINIGGKAGDPVRAAADGVVVYSGDGLVGYGELVVIKHNDDYFSAYGHNSKRLVKEGDRVQAGQVIARMGSTGAPRDELEFQVRYKGNPVNPLDYLPKR